MRINSNKPFTTTDKTLSEAEEKIKAQNVKFLEMFFHRELQKMLRGFIGRPLNTESIKVYLYQYAKNITGVEMEKFKVITVKTNSSIAVVPQNLYSYILLQVGVAVPIDLPEFGEWIAPDGTAYILKHYPDKPTIQEQYVMAIRQPPLSYLELNVKIGDEQ